MLTVIFLLLLLHIDTQNHGMVYPEGLVSSALDIVLQLMSVIQQRLSPSEFILSAQVKTFLASVLPPDK